MDSINGGEKVLKVLDLIAQDPFISQRQVALSTGFSLGLVNLSIRRLIKTGHIKVSVLNKKKIKYILTPKGMVEKGRHTYAYIMKTLRVFADYHRRLEALLQELLAEGPRRIAIVGDGEIASIVEMTLRSSHPHVRFRRLDGAQSPQDGELVLDCRLEGRAGHSGVSVLSRLLQEPGPNGAAASAQRRSANGRAARM